VSALQPPHSQHVPPTNQCMRLCVLTGILNTEFCFLSTCRFITGPTELGDVPSPRTPPKMFVNTDTEQEELVLVVYKVWPFKGWVQFYTFNEQSCQAFWLFLVVLGASRKALIQCSINTSVKFGVSHLLVLYLFNV